MIIVVLVVSYLLYIQHYVGGQESILNVCNAINNLHKQVDNKIIICCDDTENFDLDVFINSLDTQTKSKKQTHVQKIRMMFACCHICFTINRQCSFPLHTLLTDTCGDHT